MTHTIRLTMDVNELGGTVLTLTMPPAPRPSDDPLVPEDSCDVVFDANDTGLTNIVDAASGIHQAFTDAIISKDLIITEVLVQPREQP